jgi:hypothetical protein
LIGKTDVFFNVKIAQTKYNERLMSIGKWIVVSFILFAVFIATLVIVCMKQDISLVSNTYYQEELQFQQQIAREENTAQLERKPSVMVNEKVLTLALNQPTTVTDGTLNIFCPSNARMDRSFRIESGSSTQSFDLAELRAGMYRVRLRWTMSGKEFYQEEVINL